MLTLLPRFLLVALNIDAILAQVTLHKRREKLDKMMNGLDLEDAYSATINRIREQSGNKSKIGMDLLMWISCSERSLRADELCHALAVEVGSMDHNANNVPSIRTLLGCSLGLVTIDERTSSLRLIHFTLQEYLRENLTLFQRPHSTIAEVCLTYLNFQCVRNLSPTLCTAPKSVPFLNYASCYWGFHSKRETTECVKSLALQLLDQYDHISAKLLLINEGLWPSFRHDQNPPEGFTGLHCVAYLGTYEIAIALIEMKNWDVNEVDCLHRTPLIWAAIYGNEGIVKMLLEQAGIKPNAPDTAYGRSPLSWAAEKGHQGVVKLLLGSGEVSTEIADTVYGQTPLSWAAQSGQVDIVRLLLERGAKPDKADIRYGRTPLSWAAENAHQDVVKLLLANEEINPNVADTMYGRTPLSWAARKGHNDMVRLLLERGKADPEIVDTLRGQTALALAAEKGEESVVRVLLELGANPNAESISGQTPVSHAAQGGHENVVKVFLEREDVHLNTADNYFGLTPITWAASIGHKEVVKLLVERGGVDPELADSHRRTPLMWATQQGHKGVMALFSEWGKTSHLGPVDRHDRTPGLLDRSTQEGGAAIVPTGR